jgi:tetratricopeptide (TPR) repeat protein
MGRVYKCFLGILFILGICIPVISQNTQIDSLNQLLETLPEDTTKANILVQLTFEYRNIDAKKSIEIAQEALELSKQLGFKAGIAKATRNIGLGYYKAGSYDTALIILDKAMITAKDINSLRIQADILNTKGVIYFLTGKMARAQDAFLQNQKMYEQLGRESDLAGSYANLASIQKDQGDYPNAFKNFHKALQIVERINYLDGQAVVLFNMADMYNDRKEYAKAREFYQRTARLDSLTGNVTGMASSLSNIAGIYEETGEYDLAIRNYHQAIKLDQKAGAECDVNLPMSHLGSLYLDLKQYDSALHYINTSLQISKQCNNQSVIIENNFLLSKYYLKFRYSSALLMLLNLR